MKIKKTKKKLKMQTTELCDSLYANYYYLRKFIKFIINKHI